MLHGPFILAQKHLGQRTKNQIAEGQPMQTKPVSRKVNATFHLGYRCGHQSIGNPRATALHQLDPLIREDKVDRGRHRPAVDALDPMKRPAILRRPVRSHPEAIGDRLKDFRLLMHPRITAPPRMDVRSMNRIDKPDDTIIGRAGIGQGNVE